MTDQRDLEGTLQTMSIAEVLQWAAAVNKSGALEVEIPTGKRSLYFIDGEIAYATSAQKSEKMGAFLIRSRKLKKSQVQRLRMVQRETRRSFDGIALEEEFLTRQEVEQVVESLIESVFRILVVEDRGKFKFLEGKQPPRGAIPVRIPVQEMLPRGLKVRMDWKEICHSLPDREVRLRPTARLSAQRREKMDARELRLLDMLDGETSLQDVRARSPLPEFETCGFLARLIRGGILEDADAPGAEIRNLDHEIQRAAEQIDAGEHFEALTRLNQILARRPAYPMAVHQRDRVLKLLDHEAEKVIPSLGIVPCRNPAVDPQQVEGLQLDSREGYLLSRVDDRSSIQDLSRLVGLTGAQIRRILFKMLRYGLILLDAGDGSTVRESSGVRKGMDRNKVARHKVMSGPEEGAEDREELPESKKPEVIPKQLKYTLAELNELFSKYLKMNYYEQLGVTRAASKEQLREAYGRLSKLYHPDMYFKDRQDLDPKIVERLSELFGMVYTAYKTLSSSHGRGKYDRDLTEKKKVEDLGQSVLYEDFLKDFSEAVERGAREKRRQKRERAKRRNATVETPEPEVPPEPEEEEPPETVEPVDILTAVKEAKGRPRDRVAIGRKHFERGQELFEAGKYREAMAELTEAVKRDAREHEYYALLARCQLKAGRMLEQATDNAKRAIMLHKEHPPYYILLSRIYRAMEDLHSAERYMKIAVAWDPSDKEATAELKEIREEKDSSLFKRLFKRKK